MSPGDMTPADRAGPALKRERDALDSASVIRTQELKLRIEQSEYTIDPNAVAAAMLRHAVSQRRWWNPTASRATPSSVSATPGAPSATDPIHVSGAASSAAWRSPGATHTQSS